MDERREVRRDELPAELRPLFDALTFEITRVAHVMAAARRVRAGLYVALGGLLSATAINVGVAIWRP